MKQNYYQPSGKFSLKSIVLFFVLSVTLFPLWGGLYAYAIWYIPFIYINFIITGIFAFGIGFMISQIVFKIGKVRNLSVGYGLGILGVLITLYLHWAVWTDLAINVSDVYGNSRIGVAVSNTKFEEVTYLIMHPNALWEAIWEINEYGTWSLRTLSVNGIFLAIIWGVEFIGVMIIALFVSVPQVKEPFCEKECVWFDEEELAPLSYIEHEEKINFVGKLEKLDATILDTLEKVLNVKEESHSIFRLYSSNGGEYYLSVENKKAKKNKKGEVEFDGDEFLNYVKTNKEIADKLKSM